MDFLIILHKNAVYTPALSLTSSASQWCFSQTLQHLKNHKKNPVSKHTKLKGQAECTLQVDRVWNKILLVHCLLATELQSGCPSPSGGITEEHMHRYILPGYYLEMLTLIMHSSAKKTNPKTCTRALLNFQSTLLDH